MSLQEGDLDIREIVLKNIEKDEADCRKLGIPHRFMQLSALSPTTRNSHADRHGLLLRAMKSGTGWHRTTMRLDANAASPLS